MEIVVLMVMMKMALAGRVKMRLTATTILAMIVARQRHLKLCNLTIKI